MSSDRIAVRGARVHNLRNVDVALPRNRLVVITGLSGSGKSSLAFDTIYAEGQRRYVESLSAYARQFLEQMEKPDVDLIEGLSPAISIEQKTTGSNPRSTVGTVTEIYDYLRLLFANVGVPHCPECDREITSQTIERIVDLVMSEPPEERVNVLAPVVRGRKGEFKRELLALRTRGFTRARIDGQFVALENEIKLDRRKNHSIDVMVDRLVIKPGVEKRLAESIDLALRTAEDIVVINTLAGGDRLFSRRMACPNCGISIPEMSPRAFSFNSPHGACQSCQGLGAIYDFDLSRIVPDDTKSLEAGAIAPWAGGDRTSIDEMLAGLQQAFAIDPQTPFGKLPKKLRDIVLFGAPGRRAAKTSRAAEEGDDPFGADFEGVIPNMRRRFEEGTWTDQEGLEPYRTLQPCSTCSGARLRPESRSVRVKGHRLAEFVEVPISDALPLVESLTFNERETAIAGRVIREIRDRLKFLLDVGVGYLTLSRGAATLSGGEGQRIRLATQIGSQLTGVLYVLDEPSIGLHQRDNRKLLGTLGKLRNLGNTVLVVEHDEETIRTADYLVDLGPGAGEHGGHVMFQGAPQQLIAAPGDSLTGQYLAGSVRVEIPGTRRKPERGELVVRGARANNLKNIDVAFPLGMFIAITGVSGSGKSTLVNDIVYRSLAKQLYRAADEPGAHNAIEGIELVDKVIQIDQSPIGRTPRSNPATYTGLFTFIRELFAMLPEARQRGYKAGRFSFNVKGGRCEACQGDGVIAIEMHFLPNVYVTCEECKGRRYNRETLEIKYRGKSIAEMLDLTVDQALELVENFPPIAQRLRTLREVGLGYIELGQSATTLSGGEAQRVKLSRELARRAVGRLKLLQDVGLGYIRLGQPINTLSGGESQRLKLIRHLAEIADVGFAESGPAMFVLDEPTTGLHFEDVRILLTVLQRLVESGNSLLVIEHNLDVIKCADWVIDLGPDAGDKGGHVVAAGTREQIRDCPKSHTGAALRQVLPCMEFQV